MPMHLLPVQAPGKSNSDIQSHDSFSRYKCTDSWNLPLCSLGQALGLNPKILHIEIEIFSRHHLLSFWNHGSLAYSESGSASPWRQSRRKLHDRSIVQDRRILSVKTRLSGESTSKIPSIGATCFLDYLDVSFNILIWRDRSPLCL